MVGNKVKMSEVHDMKDSISTALENLSSNTKTLKTSIENFSNDSDFVGLTATSIHNYNKSFHIETIQRLDEIKEEFDKVLKNAVNSFHSEVDNDHSAILNRDGIDTYKEELDKAINNIEETKTRMNGTIASVRDLTSAQTITGSEVKDKGDELTKHIKKTIRDFENFQNEHGLDEVDLLSKISPIGTMASKVKNMPSNRSTIASSATDIRTQYKLHSENNQFTQLKEELEKYEAAVYGGAKNQKYVKDLAKLTKYFIVTMIAGDGDYVKGDRLLKNNKTNEIGKKKLKLMNGILSTNIENIKGDRISKAASFLLNNPKDMKKSDKFITALKISNNYDDKELKSIRKIMKQPKKQSMLKMFGKGALDETISEDMRKFLKDPSKLKSITLEQFKDFKGKNWLGKSLKTLRFGGKLLGPLGNLAVLSLNFVNEKSWQKKFVGAGVDLGAIAVAAGTGAMVGGALAGPFGAPVGAAIGLGASALVGFASEIKLSSGKSITDMTKDKVNKEVNSIKHKAADSYDDFKNFGKSLGKLF